MSASRYVTVSIKNTESAAVTVVVKDPDGNDHTIQALAPGAEMMLLTPTDATWGFNFGTRSEADGGLGPLDPSSGKGRGQGATSG